MQNTNCKQQASVPVRLRRAVLPALAVLAALVPLHGAAQMSTTTVQGTIYRADGTPAGGTVLISWPAFTTPQDQAVAAGSLSASIGANGFLSVSLTPNAGALPSGSYYTAVYHLTDGTVNQEYWVVPVAPTATVAAVRALLQPSTVAVAQTVTPAYVDNAVSEITGNYLPLSGGTLTGPLNLNSDPMASGQAATKHYADQLFAQTLPLSGGTLTGPLNAPSISLSGNLAAPLATTDLGRTNRVSVKECGAMGNSTVGNDGNDDTAAITACVVKLCADGGGTLFFPAGLYRTTANIPIACSSVPAVNNGSLNSMTIRLAGDSPTSAGIVMTSPAQPLFSVLQGSWQVKFENLSLYGLGTATTGNLVENFRPWTTFSHVHFNGTGGICLLQDAERMYLSDVKFLNCRQAWVQGATATNETYARDLEAINFGYTENPFLHSGVFSWDLNAANGVNPAPNTGSGGAATPVIQNSIAAFVLAGNSVNNRISGCSIKGASDVSAVRVIHGENIEIDHCYFEGWTSSPPAGLGENLSIINGGYNPRSLSKTALASTTIPAAAPGSPAVNAWSVTLQPGVWSEKTGTVQGGGIWFRNQVGFTSELAASIGDSCVASTCYAGYILPPDFSWASNAPSSIGGGILQNSYEEVLLYGTVGNTLYIQTRGYNGTTQYNWPAGAIYVEGDGLSPIPSDALHLTDDHFDDYQLLPGYVIAADPNHGETNGAEIENGWMPDDLLLTTTINPGAAKNILFTGNNRVRNEQLEAHILSRVQVDGSDYASLWTNNAASFDTNPLISELGGLQVNTVTYSNGAASISTVQRPGGFVATSGAYTNAPLGYRDYLASTAEFGQVHQFLGSYQLCDGSGSGSVPRFCNLLDAGGTWKRFSYNNGTWSSLGGYAATDANGNVTLPGSLHAETAVTGASINGEFTVDGVLYTSLNAAWIAAVAQATATGQNQTVRLGPGTFSVSATLTEPANGACVNLLGSAGVTMNADSPQIATTLTVPASLGGDVVFLGNSTQAQGCTFRDLSILAAGNATHGFELQWFRGLLLDNVTVNDTMAEGVLLGEETGSHQASFLLRNVTVSYSSGAFTPANRPAWGIHLQKTAIDSHLDNIVVRNALTAAVWNEGTGNTGYLIHGFGYPYTCTTAPCVNNAASGSAANASYATNYVIYDTGGAGSVWTDTYADSPAVAGFYIGANGTEIHGGHIQWPDLTSFPSANLAYVAANVSNNLLIADVDCLEMASGVNWITYAGTAGNPPTYASVHHLTGCGNYYQSLEPANTSGFSSGGANINDPSGAVPRLWSTPIAAASSYPAFSAQMYTGYQGDAFQAHFSGVAPFFNVTYQGTIRSSGGLALGTVINTASMLTLTPANKNVIANAAGGPQTLTLPSCYTPLVDNTPPTGLEFTIVKSDSSTNTVTLQTTSSQLIYSQGTGAATLVLSTPSTQTLVCGPDYNWYVAGTAAAAVSGSAVTSFNGRVGAVVPQASDYAASYDTAGAAATAQSNAEAFSANASNITAGKLPHAQLPALVSADIPNNTASTTGNASTATALAATPTQCATGYYSSGIAASGAANCLQSWRFTWHGYFGGTFGTATNTSMGAIWSPSAAIGMTRLDIAVGTAPAGCTTYPVIGIYDGTSSTWLKTIALAAATYSYRNAVTGVSITAGHNLSMGVQTAGVGCSTSPGNAQLTMEYTMNQ